MDWLDQHGEDDLRGPAWEDLVVHARSCVDCGLALKQRAELREALRTLPSPDVPAHLAAAIIQNLDTGAGEVGASPLRDWLERLLPPVQYGLAATATVVALALFAQAESNPFASPPGMRPTGLPTGPSRVTLAATTSKEPLLRLSPAEIAEFRQKLAAYKRLHPEMERPPNTVGPAALVGHFGR